MMAYMFVVIVDKTQGTADYQQVLRETAGKSEKEIRQALRDAYPFGEREYHPYKIWCDEIQRQRGFKKKKCTEKARKVQSGQMEFSTGE